MRRLNRSTPLVHGQKRISLESSPSGRPATVTTTDLDSHKPRGPRAGESDHLGQCSGMSPERTARGAALPFLCHGTPA